MNKKIFLTFILITSFNLISMGQLIPIKNIPSPEIGNLGEYGKVPVSLFTGVPEISIPLYELKAGNFLFPISASYHLSSVKPNAQSGCLGLGWSLLADGYITRSVRGMYDEKCESNGYAPGYYAHASKLQNMSYEEFEEATKHIQSVDNDYYELSADEFSFSFNGYSGNFYYQGDGKWSVISEQDIKVEFNPANGEGFINSNQLGERINLRGWGGMSRNNRFFNKFTLITPDGCRYEFGGLQATEYSIPYYARYNSDLIATTWKLSRITTVDKRVIEFSYDISSILCDIKYVPQHKITTGTPSIPQNPQVGRAGMTGYLIFPVNIKTIKTPNETLEFNYYNDYGYSSRFVDTYLAWGNDTAYGRNDIYSIIENPANQFHLFLGNGIDVSSENALRNTIKATLKNRILHSIYIRKAIDLPIKTIYFDYIHNTRRKLSLITERPGNPELVPEYRWGTHEGNILVGYQIPPIQTKASIQEYGFKYDTSCTMPNDYVRANTDSWGYFSGGMVSFSSYPLFTLKSPAPMYTKAEVLKEVTYPTGGKSCFEYDLNTYAKIVNPSLGSVNMRDGTSGGLRVKKIVQLSHKDSVLGSKKFYYSDEKSENGRSSGIARNNPLHEILYYTAKGEVCLTLKSEGGFFAEVTNLNSPDVGYSCVIEEAVDKDGISQGYIKRYYSNFDQDIYGKTHYDEPPVYSELTGNSYTKPFTSRSMERGKLLAEEYYNKNDLLKKKVNYTYKQVNSVSFVSAQQLLLVLSEDPYQYVDHKIGTLTRTYTHAYMMDSIIETEKINSGNIVFTKKQVNEYNNHKQLSRVTTQNSKGENTYIDYTYAASAAINKWMDDNHILSPISCKKEQTGTTFRTESYTYGKVQEGIPYIRSAEKNINGYPNSFYTAKSTDKYGNPIEIEEQGLPVILIWGGKGQQIIARIENVTYDVLSKILDVAPDSFSSLALNQINYRKIEDIRHLIPTAHFYIYKYTPEMYLESETVPNGATTFYKYDFSGKLRETYYFKL